MSFDTYKDITLEDMMEYIEKNAPKDKEWFKSEAIITNKNEKQIYNSSKAKKAFCKKYMPNLLPETKAKKANKTDTLLNW